MSESTGETCRNMDAVGAPAGDSGSAVPVSFLSALVLFLSALTGGLFFLSCYVFGSSFYVYSGVLLYQQCFFGLLAGLSAFLFRRSGSDFRLWSSALIFAGLTPFVTWLAHSPGQWWLECNVWLLVAVFPVMLHYYLMQLLAESGRLAGVGGRLVQVLQEQRRLILYGMVVPFGAFAGAALVSSDYMFTGLLQRIFSGEFQSVSRYMVCIIGINLLLLIVDSVWFFMAFLESLNKRKQV